MQTKVVEIYLKLENKGYILLSQSFKQPVNQFQQEFTTHLYVVLKVYP